MDLVKSMTGYGRGEQCFEDGVQLTVELRSVNNRYLDCTVKMPRAYIFAEDAMKARIQSGVARGKVDVFVTITRTGGDDVVVTVNEALAKSYVEAIQKLHELGLGRARREYYPTDLARFPDVLMVEKRTEDLDEMKERLLAVLGEALADFNAMRAKEGERLAEDILGRADTIERLLGEVEARSPQTVNDYRARLEAKMREVLQNTQIDEGRLLTEAAIFADKVAVDEETVRLHSHL
ncbi:MAG: YicC family protein, partial [Oscillospiraceae bacterium]|nr:YicC family protein [Oscillospiraceae bacterium]